MPSFPILRASLSETNTHKPKRTSPFEGLCVSEEESRELTLASHPHSPRVTASGMGMGEARAVFMASNFHSLVLHASVPSPWGGQKEMRALWFVKAVREGSPWVPLLSVNMVRFHSTQA